MLNQMVLVGKVKEIKKQKEKTIIKLGVTRSYKNSEGIYETDIISINVNNNIADNFNKYCTIGDVIGIKGHIETKNNRMVLIADRLTFLSSKGSE